MNHPPRTKAQAYKFEVIKREIGCIPCLMRGVRHEADVHHAYDRPPDVNRNDHVYSCCPWHHRGVTDMHPDAAEAALGPSMARSRHKYREVFGDEQTLVDACESLFQDWRKTVVGGK